MSIVQYWEHPGLFVRKAVGKVRRRFARIPEQPAIEQINGRVRFEFRNLPFLYPDDIRAMLTRSYDLNLCEFLTQHLKPGDIFIDVGANVGYISAVAASLAGRSGEVHGFEPLPECYARLQRLRELNPDFPFFFHNVALGETEGVLPIVYNPEGESRNATLVPGFTAAATRDVPVRRLDDYILAKISAPERIKMIKIDVEGFEYSVLRGLQRFLSETGVRPCIACEIKPWTVSRLGGSMEAFDAYMSGFGYKPYLLTGDVPTPLRDLSEMETVVFRA